MNATSAPIPATFAAGLRIAIAVIGPLGIQKGWWGESDLANIAAAASAIGAAAYGLYKTHDRQTRLNNSAPIGRSVIR